MSFQEHVKLMATYNARMNTQLYQAASQLDDEKLNKDLGAYFKSVLGTLNHLMVGDLIWLTRFKQHSKHYRPLNALSDLPSPSSLDCILFPVFNDLRSARILLDQILVDWSSEVNEEDFHKNLSYKNSKGIPSTKNFGELILHLLNHQTHHRGQLSTLLSQQGIDVGITDFLIDIPNNIE